MKLKKWILTLIVILPVVFFYGASVSLTQQDTGRGAKVLAIGPQSSIRYTAPWKTSAVRYSNAQELVITREVRTLAEGREQVVEYALARVLITTEPRSSPEDALMRLDDIATSRPESALFVEVGGWPAVKLEFVAPLPRRGQEGAQADSSDVRTQRAIVAIAADTNLVRFDISLGRNAPSNLLQEAIRIASSARFAKRGDPEMVRKELQRMREAKTKQKTMRAPSPGPAKDGLETRAAGRTPNLGVPVTVPNGSGELEVAASANANNVVIASNAGLSFSTNRGASFNPGVTGVFGPNDPSLARAASGNFYLGVIAFPIGTPAQLNGIGCANAVSRSTNNGANFGLQGYSALCPLFGFGMGVGIGMGVCFPDQEHIAADAINATAAGNDQLYSVWRNFTPDALFANCTGIGSGFVTASISCSQNNGTNWTAAAPIVGAGDFPRVAVGRDGNVYTVTSMSLASMIATM
jgi:hypothetical protein